MATGRTPADTFARLQAAAIAAPGIGYQSPLVVGLRLAGIVAEKTGASLLQVSAAFGVAGLAIGAVSLVLKGMTDAAEKTTRQMRQTSATFNEIGLAAFKSTRDQLLARQEAAAADMAYWQAVAKTANKNVTDYILANPETTIPVTGIVAESLKGQGGELGGLKATADDANEALRNAQNEFAALSQVLLGNSYAAATAAAAEEELRKAREQSAGELINAFDQEADLRVKLSALRRNGTSDQVKDEIAANTDRAAIIRNFLLPAVETMGYSTEVAAQKTSDLKNEIDFLTHSNDLLLQAVLPVIEAREREAEAAQLITDQYDQYLAALDTEIKIREEIAATIEKINQIIADRDEKLAEMAADYAEKRQQIEVDAQEKLADIAEKSADRIGKIMRDAGREQFAAVAERDAKAFYMSQIKAKDALDDQKLADKRAIEQLAKTIAKQEAQLDRTYQKQIDALTKSTNKQLDIQYKALQQQEVDLSNAQAALAAIALNGSGGLVTIQNNMWSTLNTIAGNWANTIATNVGNALWGIGGGAGGIGPGGIGGVIPGVLGGMGGALNAVINRAVDARIGQMFNVARTGRAFG